MNRLALSCRPTQSLEAIVTKATRSGIRVFDTPFIPTVPQTLQRLAVNTSNDHKTRIFLRTTEHSEDALEFQVRTFSNIIGKTADLYLVTQDPEYDPEGKSSANVSERMGTMFEILEQFVVGGLLKGYGVSSNGLSFGSLTSESIDAANPGNGFSMAQLSLNIIERNASQAPLLHWMKKRKLEVCTNRPLSAFDEKGSWRLVEATFPEGYAGARDALIKHLTPPITASEGEKEASQWMINLINRLDEQLSHFTSIIHWESELAEQIIPLIDKHIEELDERTHHLLLGFFEQFGLAVRESGGFQARERVLVTFPDMKNKEDFRSLPLHHSAMKFVLDHPDVDLVSVHASNEGQIDDWVRFVQKYYPTD